LTQRHSSEHIDWQWEHLETVLASIVETYPHMRQFFRPAAFQDDGGIIPKVRRALALEWFLPFAELLSLVGRAVGQ
jgi:hypothetical protein